MKAFLLLTSMGLGALGLLGGCKGDEGPQNTVPERQSHRGESCSSTNDCREDLACVNNVCILNEYPVASNANECVLVECSEDAECCAGFIPPTSCPTLQEACTAGDLLSCDTYDALCVCQQICVEEQCELAGVGCTEDTECSPFFCEAGTCVQCRTNDHCPTGTACVNNVCRPPCTRNEECALFSACQNGECVETGCTTQRECILFTGDPQAECRDGECRIPCETNSQCGLLQTCENGACMFIGCDNDTECRAYYELSEISNISAVCRAP